MRNLICLPVLCVLFLCQIGCCSYLSKGTWNDNISGLWSWRSGATTAPESATFANQGLYLGQQSRYISPPTSDPVVAASSNVTAPLPNATPAPNPVVPSAATTTPPPATPTSNSTSTPFSNVPYADPFGTTTALPNTVPATPTLTALPQNYLTATTPTQPNQSFAFTAPNADAAIPASQLANNAGSIGTNESLFAPKHGFDTNVNSNSNSITNSNNPSNIAPLNNNTNQYNSNPNNINVPLTAYEIAAAGTAETAFQSMETRAGTQIQTSQNGVTTVTVANSLPVTSSSHFVTEIKPAE
ncbi:MAG: hypothetical protein LBT09_05335 [Planctomycetaceae bacterium]|jgi:hypothetical protein|nr:hypothetical protein [Planctomycetaceae bacterium]